jgi:hypothetical protein
LIPFCEIQAFILFQFGKSTSSLSRERAFSEESVMKLLEKLLQDLQQIPKLANKGPLDQNEMMVDLYESIIPLVTNFFARYSDYVENS